MTIVVAVAFIAVRRQWFAADLGFPGAWDDYVLAMGGLAVASIGIIALVERLWSPVKKWLQNALTNPVLAKMGEIEEKLEERDDHLQGQVDTIGSAFKEFEGSMQHRVGRLEEVCQKIERNTEHDS